MSEKSIIALISIALLVYWIGSIFFIVLAVLAVFGLGVLIFQMINKHRDKKSKSNLFTKKIYVNINNVFNAKVSEGTTILDLAFLYDTEIGIHCNGGYVNRYRKSLSYALHNNDVVSFITDKNIYPKKEWLDYVTTELAKQKIEDYLRKKNDINEIEQKNIQSTVEIDSDVNTKESNKGKYKLEVKQEPELKKELLSNTIEVFTPNKMRIQLKKGVSVLDFAFFIHTDLGLHCIGANVNGVFQCRNYILKNGDNIEILTDDKQYPSRKWLKYATTKKAIKNIENYLSKKSCLNKNKEPQKVIESNNDIYSWRKNVYWEIYHSSAKKEIDVILKNKDYAKGIIIIEDTIKKMESEGLPCRYWERMLEVMKKKEYDKEKADGITNILCMLQGNAKDKADGITNILCMLQGNAKGKADGVANILYMLREYSINRKTMCSTEVKNKNFEKIKVLYDIQIDGIDKPEEKIYITNIDVKKQQNRSEYITIFIKRQYMDLAIQIPIGVTVSDFISYVSSVVGIKCLSTNVNGNKQTDNYVLQERDTVNVLNIETEETIDWHSVIAKSKDKGKNGNDKYKAKRINIIAKSDNNKQDENCAHDIEEFGGAISEQIGNVISKRDVVVEIDKQKLESIKKETLEAQSILSNIFVEEDNDENNPQDIKEDNPIMDILKSLLNKEQWQYSEVEELCKKYNVMMGFVLERINDYAFEKIENSVIDDDGEFIYVSTEYKNKLI